MSKENIHSGGSSNTINMEPPPAEEIPPMENPPVAPVAPQKSSSRMTRRSRRKKGCCVTNIVGVPLWGLGEWLAFLLLLLLGMYAIGGLFGNRINLKAWEGRKSIAEPKMHPKHVHTMMAYQGVLLLAVIAGFYCLIIRRDIVGYVLVFFLVLVTIVFLFYLIGHSGYMVGHEEDIIDEMYGYIKEEIYQHKMRFEFHAIERQNECCGVRDWKDYKILGPRERLPKDAVNEACCRSKVTGLACESVRIKALSMNADAVSRRINTKGCGHVLVEKFRHIYLTYLLEAIVAEVILLIILIILIHLYYRWYKETHRTPSAEWINQREQEDDNESLIVPGTPLKSYVDVEDAVFYAP